MIRLRLTGPDRALAQALDRLLVGTTVLGVVERPGECEVAVAAEPAVHGWLATLRGVSVEELPVDPTPVTGLEQDRALRVGERILVRPPWVPAPAGFDGVELVVPRALAFGSGEHGSTRAALCVMERLFDPAVRSLADVGTGSGILALYAVRRGCPRVWACDLEDAAVVAARALLPGATVVHGGPEALGCTADMVVANLRGSELAGCLEALLGLWNRRGPLVLAGLRPAEEAALVARVPPPVTERVEIDGFVALGWCPPGSGP